MLALCIQYNAENSVYFYKNPYCPNLEIIGVCIFYFKEVGQKTFALYNFFNTNSKIKTNSTNRFLLVINLFQLLGLK